MGKKRSKRKFALSGYSRVRKFYYINGKRKSYIQEFIDGIPIHEWYNHNAGPIEKLINGDYWMIDHDENGIKPIIEILNFNDSDIHDNVFGVEHCCEDENGMNSFDYIYSQ